MTFDKVHEILRRYASDFRAAGALPVRDSGEGPLPLGGMDKDHLLWMCEEVLTWPDERKEKAMRWLGFIQGVLAIIDGVPINTLKDTNKPAGGC